MSHKNLEAYKCVNRTSRTLGCPPWSQHMFVERLSCIEYVSALLLLVLLPLLFIMWQNNILSTHNVLENTLSVRLLAVSRSFTLWRVAVEHGYYVCRRHAPASASALSVVSMPAEAGPQIVFAISACKKTIKVTSDVKY